MDITRIHERICPPHVRSDRNLQKPPGKMKKTLEGSQASQVYTFE